MPAPSSPTAAPTQSPQVVPSSEHFVYRDARLYCDAVALSDVAEAFDTPSFVYSGAAIDAAYASIDDALSFSPHRIAYAVKANGNLAILARLGRLGAAADVVSAGELLRALQAGIAPQDVVFSGVGKRDEELVLAIDQRIRSLHVESLPELEAIERLASARKVRVPVALRINPDIDPQTHPYISTGLHQSKFGLELEAARTALPRLLTSPHLNFEGIACHIGSQLSSAQPLGDAATRVARFAQECIEAGAPLRMLDLGGGWPVAYGDETQPLPSLASYGDALRQGLMEAGAMSLGLELWVELGRCLVADAGVLLTRVIYVKERPEQSFVIVDAAMTELLRPALYGAYHAVMPIQQTAVDAPTEITNVVGPVCESSDFLALDRHLPRLQRGDLLAVRGAGAYAASMSSTYNARRRAAEVLVDGETFRIVRQRDSWESLWQGEHP